ncbi:MAG: response regulator [Candidatus Cloacimonetes bacterium]|nr:response regulator [Candidatus Cloacimonadota bacterium]
MESSKPEILIVDDRVENLIALETLLSDFNVAFIRALSGNEALEKTLTHDFALMLIDVQMPEMDGFETVSFIRNINKSKHIPIIFVSAIYSEDFYKIKGVEAGAVDFITKPIIPELLIGKVKIFLELHKQKIERERLISELKEALNNIKTLKGLLPICASCKKIRDDKGYWSEVESYISLHSDVAFSHGICPDCMKKLYPDVYKKLQIKKRNDHESKIKNIDR